MERNNELDALFATYKSAMPDPEPSVNFMPALWRKIEAKQSFAMRVKKLTHLFVAAAAAICLLFAMIEVVPGSSYPEANGSYVDVLAATHPAESLAGLGIVTHDSAEPNIK